MSNKSNKCNSCKHVNVLPGDMPCRGCSRSYNNYEPVDKKKENVKDCFTCKYYLNTPEFMEPCKSCGSASGFPNWKSRQTEESKKENSESVNHPAHYQGKNECIDVMEAMFGVDAVIAFCKCNAFKYRFRANMKNGEEDIMLFGKLNDAPFVTLNDAVPV